MKMGDQTDHYRRLRVVVRWLHVAHAAGGVNNHTWYPIAVSADALVVPLQYMAL